VKKDKFSCRIYHRQINIVWLWRRCKKLCGLLGNVFQLIVAWDRVTPLGAFKKWNETIFKAKWCLRCWRYAKTFKRQLVAAHPKSRLK
jgi:hypothetical protein